VTRPVITLPPLAAPVDELWHALLDLDEQLTAPWTLVGGQMVLLHALEHGQVPPQVSQDGDVVADVRAQRSAIKQVVAQLESMGFELDGMSPDLLAHRYARLTQYTAVKVDVLAPEGVGQRADLTTTRPGRTVQVPGGTQALDRTERVTVLHEGRTGTVPRPSLLGALVAKGAACGLPGDSSRHLRDLALLCALVPDPFTMVDEMTKKDKKRIRLAAVLHDEAHPAWQLVPTGIRGQGRAAYQILTAD